MLSTLKNSLIIFIQRLFGFKDNVVPLSSEVPVELPQVDISPRKYNLRSRKQVNYVETEDTDVE